MPDGEIKVRLTAVADKASFRKAAQQGAEETQASMGSAAYGLASSVKGLPSESKAPKKRDFAADERRGRMQAAAEVAWEKEEAMRKKTRLAEQERLGLIPPKLKAGVPPGGGPPGGLSAIAASGIPYVSTLARAVFTPIGAAAAAVGVGLMALRKAINETVAAYDRARALYAKQLQSGGMAGGYVTQMDTLSRVMAVGSQDVIQFGAAMAYLNDRLANATKIFTDTNRTLTATSWGFKTMSEDMAAMWAKVAEAAAPLFNILVETVSAIAKFIANSGIAATVGKLFASTILLVATHISVATVQFSYFAQGIAKVTDALGISTGAADKISKARTELMKGIAEAWINSTTRKAPDMPVSTNRLASSAWEKMGLIIGGAGGTNYNQQTAMNTRKLVTLMTKLVEPGTARSGSGKMLYSQP